MGEAAARIEERRSEERQDSTVERAVLHFRGRRIEVPVIDISARGTQIECAIEPRLGESVIVRFEGCSPLYAFVRWSRQGRIGLNFGCELVLV